MFNPLVDYFKGHIKSKIEAAVSVYRLHICRLRVCLCCRFFCNDNCRTFVCFLSSLDLPCCGRIHRKPGVPPTGHERYCSSPPPHNKWSCWNQLLRPEVNNVNQRIDDSYIFLLSSVSFDVDENVTFDLPLISIPIVNASSMNLGLKVKMNTHYKLFAFRKKNL